MKQGSGSFIPSDQNCSTFTFLYNGVNFYILGKKHHIAKKEEEEEGRQAGYCRSLFLHFIFFFLNSLILSPCIFLSPISEVKMER